MEKMQRKTRETIKNYRRINNQSNRPHITLNGRYDKVQIVQLKRKKLSKMFIKDPFSQPLPDKRQISINEVPHSTLKRLLKTHHGF